MCIRDRLAGITQKKIEEMADNEASKERDKATEAKRKAKELEIKALQKEKRQLSMEGMGGSCAGPEEKSKKDGDEDPRSMGTKIRLAKNKLRSMGLKMSYDMEGNQIDERTRYAKETGKDFKTGNPSEKGGTRTGDTAFDQVSRQMRKTGGMMSSRGNPIQPQGKTKTPGAKGYKGVTPVDKIKGKLAQKRRAQEYNPYKPRMGESD